MQDVFGFTALHHAAVFSEEIYKYLLENGAVQDIKTNLKGRAEDIRRLTLGETHSHSRQAITYIDESGNLKLLSQMNPEELKKATGLEKWCDDVYIPGESLLTFWGQSEDVEKMFNRNLKEDEVLNTANQAAYQYSEDFYRIYTEQPHPKLILQHSKEIQSVSGVCSIGLMGGEKIEIGQPFAIYSGKLKFKEFISNYSIPGIDGETIGSHGSRVNYGFPNAVVMPLVIKGYKTKIFVACDTIKKEEEIVANYGPTFTQLTYDQPMCLIGKERMVAHFKKGLDRLLKEEEDVWNVKRNNLSMVKVLSLNAKLTFPLSAPMALIYLHYENIILVHEWKKSLQQGKIREWGDDSNMIAYRDSILNIIEIISDLDSALASLSKLRVVVQSWIKKKIEKVSVSNLVNYLKVIKEQIKMGNLKEDSTEADVESIIKNEREDSGSTEVDEKEFIQAMDHGKPWRKQYLMPIFKLLPPNLNFNHEILIRKFPQVITYSIQRVPVSDPRIIELQEEMKAFIKEYLAEKS